MRSLESAKDAARSCRKLLGIGLNNNPKELTNRLIEYLESEHDIYAEPVHPVQLAGSLAEIEPPYLFYDERLEATPLELLAQIAHEYGHLKLHGRIEHRSYRFDPLAGAVYMSRHDAVASARYSKRSREEAEATAFAIEFLCPSDEAFDIWFENTLLDLDGLAKMYCVPTEVARIQLVEALHRKAQGLDRVVSFHPPELKPNPKQDAAIAFSDGTVLVDAGPGTGKTTALVRHAQYLLKKNLVQPQKILVLTFSNETARELEQRLNKRIGAPAREIFVATFHGFGRHILHYVGDRAGIDQHVAVIDQTVQEELLLEALGRVDAFPILDLNRPENTAEEVIRHINFLKQRLRTPFTLGSAYSKIEQENNETVPYSSRVLLELFKVYEELKSERGAVDFADLISIPIQIFQEYPATATLFRDQYHRILVDEFQDVTTATSQLLRLLCGDTRQPWIVGDARQSIYRFLGADPSNVTDFKQHFPEAKLFELNLNFRACDPIVQEANKLATLLEDPAYGGGPYRKRWEAASNQTPAQDPAVAVAKANSDQSEREGIAKQIESWIEDGARPQDIAVLARRNVDVQEIALALDERNIDVVVSGMITPEGPAGDLLAVASLPDSPSAALPRIANALFPNCHADEINAAIQQLLSSLRDQEGIDLEPDFSGGRLSTEVARVCGRLLEKRSCDAFTLMCDFLFQASNYLRRILDRSGSKRAIALAELATTLGRAALYRFTHPEYNAAALRQHFCEYFRRALTDATSNAVAPGRVPGAVSIMTCHASKGLQFPYVVAAGQTLPSRTRDYDLLPTSLQPPEQADLEQADALLFVSATRAQRALLVSHAETKSGRGRKRDLPSLLSSWIRYFEPTQVEWPDRVMSQSEVSTTPVWGGSPETVRVSVGALHPKSCLVKTYLRNTLDFDFSDAEPSLYPVFFGAIRRSIDHIVKDCHETGSKVSPSFARQRFEAAWPPNDLNDHRLSTMYGEIGSRFVSRFARVYEPLASNHRPVDLSQFQDTKYGTTKLRLGLASCFWDDDGRPVALLFRPESLEKYKSKRDGGLNWSARKLKRDRISCALLKHAFGDVRPMVYSGTDGVIYRLNWHRSQGKVIDEAKRTLRVHDLFSSGRFDHKVNPFMCDRCSLRISCPIWIGLA